MWYHSNNEGSAEKKEKVSGVRHARDEVTVARARRPLTPTLANDGGDAPRAAAPMRARARVPRQARLCVRTAVSRGQWHRHAPAPPPPQDRTLRREPAHASLRGPCPSCRAWSQSTWHFLLPQSAYGSKQRGRSLLLCSSSLLPSCWIPGCVEVKRTAEAAQGTKRRFAFEWRRDRRQRGRQRRCRNHRSQTQTENQAPPSSSSPPPQSAYMSLPWRCSTAARRARREGVSLEKNRIALFVHT